MTGRLNTPMPERAVRELAAAAALVADHDVLGAVTNLLAGCERCLGAAGSGIVVSRAMPNSPEHTAATLRLVLSSAALIVAAGGAVILALLELPQLLTLALALIAALALIDLAGTITTQQADDRSTARPTRT